MKSAGKARNNGLYRHIRTSKEIIRNLLNDYYNNLEKRNFVCNRINYRLGKKNTCQSIHRSNNNTHNY